MVNLGGEPIEVFVDPAYYVFGEAEGSMEISSSFDVSNIGSIFETDDSSIEDITTLAEDINKLDLDI